MVVRNLNIGVLSVQGSVEEHIAALEDAFRDAGTSGSAYPARKVDDIRDLHGLIIPGGESTTISRYIERFRIRDVIIEKARSGMPVMGTCAGCILMASKGDVEVERSDVRLLGLMHMEVTRNAFGRQRESFESPLEIDGFGSFHGVFIRAPAIVSTWNGCRILSRLEGLGVMAAEGQLWGLSFHPELAGDTRIHRAFIEMAESYRRGSE